MTSALYLSGDIATCATALAGLIIVYLGGVAASYAGYEAAWQPTVRIRFQRKGWFAFIVAILSLLSAALALLAKWTDGEYLARLAVLLLAAAFICGGILAFLTVQEMK